MKANYLRNIYEVGLLNRGHQMEQATEGNLGWGIWKSLKFLCVSARANVGEL